VGHEVFADGTLFEVVQWREDAILGWRDGRELPKGHCCLSVISRPASIWPSQGPCFAGTAPPGALFVGQGAQHWLFEAGADKGKGGVSIGNGYYVFSALSASLR